MGVAWMSVFRDMRTSAGIRDPVRSFTIPVHALRAAVGRGFCDRSKLERSTAQDEQPLPNRGIKVAGTYVPAKPIHWR